MCVGELAPVILPSSPWIGVFPSVNLIAVNQFSPFMGVVSVTAGRKALPIRPDNYKSLFVTDCYVADLQGMAT